MLVSAQAASNCSVQLVSPCPNKDQFDVEEDNRNEPSKSCLFGISYGHQLREIFRAKYIFIALLQKLCCVSYDSYRIASNSLLQKLHEARHDAGRDDLVDRRVRLAGEQLPELGRGLQLQGRVLGEERLHHLGRYRELHGRVLLFRLYVKLGW